MYLDPQTGETKNGIKKVGYSHKAMADLLLANPAISQNEVAKHFNVTPGWISQVISSDAFQAYIADRREEIIDPVLRGAVEDSFKSLVLQSIEVLRRKLEAAPSDGLALEVFKNSAKAMGYGARTQVNNVQVNNTSLVGVLSGLPTPRPAKVVSGNE